MNISRYFGIIYDVFNRAKKGEIDKRNLVRTIKDEYNLQITGTEVLTENEIDIMSKKQDFNLKYRCPKAALVKSLECIVALKKDNSIYSLRHNIPKLNQEISIIKEYKDDNFELVFLEFIKTINEFRMDLEYDDLDLEFIKRLVNS